MSRPKLNQLVCTALFALTAACGGNNNNNNNNPDAGIQPVPDGGTTCTVDQSYNPAIDPAQFTTNIDNPLFPVRPGAVFRYVEDENTVEVNVLTEQKVILGVTTVAVHDVVKTAGDITEDTIDWYAQNVDGAVWYFGEDTKTLDHGVVQSTMGSWEGGVDGAKPGIIMPAHPQVGQTYRQEYKACEAEDQGEILEVNVSATVPFGSFNGCVKTRDFTALDPAADENKFYCPSVGLVLTIDLADGAREELTEAINP